MSAERGELNRLEVLRALRISNWEAVFSQAHLVLTTGAFQTGFALWLGASDLWMGVIAAIPTFAGLTQLVSSYFVERRSERKRFTAYFSVLARVLWFPILLIPVVLPPEARLTSLIALVIASSVLLNVPGPAFISWMSDLVPPDHRGRFFGRRNMLAGITTLIISLPAAWFLDLATKRHVIPQSVGFGALFGLASISGLVSFVLLLRQPEPPIRRVEQHATTGISGMLAYYRAPFADREFRPFMVYSLLFAAGQFFAGPFYIVYALQTLKLDYVWLQVFATLTSITGLLSTPLWGYLSDKFGAKPLLGIGVAGVAILPLGWVFTSREHVTATMLSLLALHLLGGWAWAGVNLTQFNLLIGLAPAERRAVYLGAAAAITAVSGGIAPILAGVLVTATAGAQVTLGSWSYGNYQLTFAINAALRFAALLVLGRVRTPGSATAKDVLTQLGSSRVSAFWHIRRLKGPTSEKDRQAAAQALGSARISLALDELIAALDDPSPQVRIEAATALGEIGDERAVETLIAHLEDPASGMVSEIAAALGNIGDPKVIPSLTRLLAGGEKADRIAAAQALAKLGRSEAADVLVYALAAEPSDPDVLEACAIALGDLGHTSAVPGLIERLSDSPRSLRIAIVSALGRIGDPCGSRPLVELLAEEQDAAVISHIAVSLALLGHAESTGELLRSLERVDSPVASRQILHAVGTFIGDRDAFYALLGMDSFARDEAISKTVRQIEHSCVADDTEQLSSRKRARMVERAIEHYLAGEGKAVLALLQRLLVLPEAAHETPAWAAFQWAIRTAERRQLQEEELLLAVYAAGQCARDSTVEPQGQH